MKIVTWNCNGALRKKFIYLEPFGADIVIIQECENPALTRDAAYREWARNYLWTGDNKHKGLGIFAGGEIRIEKLRWRTSGLKHFIACKVGDDFNMVGTWCHGANLPSFRYIGQLWKYIQMHKAKMSPCIIAGDFNSNAIWDKPSRCWNHSDVVRELKEFKIESLYHRHNADEVVGKELRPTFYLYKNLDKPYHLDYIFASHNFISSLKTLSVGKPEEWLKMSDHMPVFCEV